MEHTQSSDTLLWWITGFVVTIMATLLVLGWLKGMYWERQLKIKKRYR